MKMCLSEIVCDSISRETLGLECSSVESVTELQVENANTVATTRVPMIKPPEYEGELNYISKYLIQYVPVKKVQKASKHATGARVLTSDECAKSIFEQDEKKRKKKKQGRLNKSKKMNKKKLLNRKQKKLLKERKRLLERKKKLLRKGKRPQEKKPKSLPTSRVVLLGYAKEPMLLIQVLQREGSIQLKKKVKMKQLLMNHTLCLLHGLVHKWYALTLIQTSVVYALERMKKMH